MEVMINMALAALDNNPIGSAGTLVAAGLEYAGHYIQSSLLDVLSTDFGAGFGGFIFTLSIIVAVFITAMGGQYKFTLWLFIGPALFFWLTLDRIDSTGVAWQSGQRVHSYDKVFAVTKDVRPASANVRVSRFFAYWDWFTSGVSQTLIKGVNAVKGKSDLHFIQTSQKYSSLFNAKSTNKEIQDFLNLVFAHPNCVRLYGLQFLNARRIGDFTDNSKIQADIERLREEQIFNKQSQNWIYMQKLLDRNAFGQYNQQIIDVANSGQSFSCMDLWQYTAEALKAESRDLINMLVVEESGEDGEDSSDEISANELHAEESMKKLASKFNESSLETPEDITAAIENMVRATSTKLMLEAIKTSNPNAHQIFVQDPLKSIEDPVNKIARKNGDKGIDGAPRGSDIYDVSSELRLHTEAQEGRPKGEFLSAMLAMPYIQGVCLYFLSMAFPIFAFLMLIPGRHSSFLLWMGLWFWIKLWDVGFAVVMLIDEVLFYLLPNGPILSEEDLTKPGEAFKLILAEDPVYSIHTYYTIIGAFLAAVPPVTGLLVKRGGGDVSDMAGQAIRGFAGRIGGTFEAFQRSGMSTTLMAKAKELEVANAQKERQKIENSPKIKALSEIQTKIQQSSNLGNTVSALKGKFAGDGQIGNFMANALNNVGIAGSKEAAVSYLDNLIAAEYKSQLHNAQWQFVSTNPAFRALNHKAVMLGNANHPLWDAYWGNAKDHISTNVVMARGGYKYSPFASNGMKTYREAMRKFKRNLINLGN